MIKGFFENNKVFFVVFFAFLLYHHIFILDSPFQTVNGAAYEFHAVDFSLGFCTKLLPGAIFHLLVGRYNEGVMTVYVRLVSVLLILLLSIAVQTVYRTLSASCGKTGIVFFILLFFAGPCAFYYSLQFEGCLDAYWIILFLVCMLFVNNKVLKWFVPLLSFLMILVHEGAILCCVPLLALVLLFKITASSDKKERKAFLAVFVLTLIVSFGAEGYFSLNNSANLRLSDIGQLREFFDSRGVSSRFYYEWYFFGTSAEGSAQNDFYPAALFSTSGSPLVQLFFELLRRIYYTVSTTDYVRPLPQILYSLPLYAALISFLIGYIKRSENRLNKFVGVCFLLLPMLCITSGLIFSNDVLRWFSHALLCLLGGAVTILCLEKSDDRFGNIESVIDKYRPLIIPYIIGYPVLMV